MEPEKPDRGQPWTEPNSAFWQSSWNSLVLQLAALSLLILAVLPAPESLGVEGFRAIGIFFVCFGLWVTSALPYPITGLLAISLIPLYGVLPAQAAFGLFGNTAVFFILGAFILASAIMKSGLSKRVALWILRRFGHGPRTLMFGVFFISWFLSLLMAEHAVAAALLPVILELVEAAETTDRAAARRYGQGLLLSMAWGTVIGGTGTLLGGARGPLAIGFLKEATGQTIGFFEWSRAVFPVTLALLPIGVIFLTLRFGRTSLPIGELRKALKAQTERQGPMTKTEWRISGVFLATILAWVLFGDTIDLATIAILSAVSLFVFRLVAWRDTEEYVNWGIILMYGGAIALGSAMTESGAAAWVAESLFSHTLASPFILLALLALVAAVLTEGMSSAAVVALMLPLGMGLADNMGIAPVPVALCVALAAGLVYNFPTGAPAVALVMTSHRLTIRDLVASGIFMSVTSWILILLLIRFYWPWIGILPQP